jgi:hypothetical protein
VLGLGKAAGDAISAPITAIGNVFDKLFTSDEEKAQAKLLLEKLAMHPAELQIELNKLEAQSRSWWVAGWRPAIGWVCGIALFVYYIPQYMMATILWTKACWTTQHLLVYPIPQIEGLTNLVYGMLGLAGLRTAEKLTNKTK